MYRYCLLAIFICSFFCQNGIAQKAPTGKSNTKKQVASIDTTHYKPMDGLGMFKIGVYTEYQLLDLDRESSIYDAPKHDNHPDIFVLKVNEYKGNEEADGWEEFILGLKNDSLKIKVYSVNYYNLGMRNALLYFSKGKLFRIWMQEPGDGMPSAFRAVYGPAFKKEHTTSSTRCFAAIKKKIKPSRDIYTWVNPLFVGDSSNNAIIAWCSIVMVIPDDCEANTRCSVEIFDLNLMKTLSDIKNTLAAGPVPIQVEESDYQKMLREMSK